MPKFFRMALAAAPMALSAELLVAGLLTACSNGSVSNPQWGHYFAGQAYNNLAGDNLAWAEDDARTALAVDTNNPAALLNLAVAYERQGRIAEAADIYARLAATPGTPRPTVVSNPADRGLTYAQIAAINLERLRMQAGTGAASGLPSQGAVGAQ